MKKLALFIAFAAVSTIALADYVNSDDIITPINEEQVDMYPVEPMYGEENVVISQDYPYGYRYGYYPLESRVEGVAHGVGTAAEGAVEGAGEIVESILP